MVAMTKNLMMVGHIMSDEQNIQGILVSLRILSDEISLSTAWRIQKLSRSLLISGLILSLKMKDSLWISPRKQIRWRFM